METRVKTRIWIQAFLRRTEGQGYMAVLIRRGDEDAGAVLIKVNRLELGCQVYSQIRDEHGQLAWFAGTGSDLVPESEADAYIQRQAHYDADLWVVEVEDPKANYGLSGPVVAV
ncbi:MAG: DUF1491 family protein [Rhodospirillaceae bacterium]